MALISEFDFEIKHIKGNGNRVVDALRLIQIISDYFESDMKVEI
jgi:hypothetical protein